MSNQFGEVPQAARANEQAAVQASTANNFDALQLHKEGAALNRPVLVADNSVMPAVYHPGENAGHIENVQYRGEHGRPNIGRDYGHRPGIVGELLYDGLVAPYRYPLYPQVLEPRFCAPTRYYPYETCYSTPLYGRERFYLPEHRRFEPVRPHHFPRGY